MSCLNAQWLDLSHCRRHTNAQILAAMSFKKPFRAKPVVLGEYARAQDARRRRQSVVRTIRLAIVGAVVVFAIGMVATHPSALPTFYPSCAWARAYGSTPIKRGEPGYRSALDADDDGIACEPYK
jgi:hypothetical protein